MLALPLFGALTALLAAGSTEPLELANDTLRLVFDPATRYAPAAVEHRAHGHNFIAPAPEPRPDRSLWRLALRDAEGRLFVLTPADAVDAAARSGGDSLTLTWSGVGSDACPAELTVTIHIDLPRDSSLSRWRIEVAGTAPAALWQVDFPRLVGLRGEGEDYLAVPEYWGRLANGPTHRPIRYVLPYPQPGSMQWHAYWFTQDRREPAAPNVERGTVESGWALDRRDATGLYWAAEDGRGAYKRFGFDSATVAGQASVWIEQVPPLDTWPIAPGPQPIDYRSPYPVAVGVFTGDFHEAATLYRQWAATQEWCRRGPADVWPTEPPPPGSEELVTWVPSWFREVGFWAKFYHEPAKVLPEWAAYRRWLGVPMASHYYRYNVYAFDQYYPDHLPGDPYLLQGIRDARAIGVRPLPYINGVIWDTNSQSWHLEDGFAAACKDPSGQIYPWDIGGFVFAYMDPSTKAWRAKVRETGAKLIGEHGTAGVYLDCLAATAFKLNYDPTHVGNLHGGDAMTQGNRRLLHDLRAATRRLDPEAAFFPEEIGEPYIDLLDGYLTLDQWRFAPRPNEQLYPLFSVVYHPYTIHFGSDTALDLAPDLFAWQMGQMLIWGSVPLHSTGTPPLPREGDPNSEFLREVVHAYWVAGLPFLQGGEWERLVVRPPDSPANDAPLDLISAPYQLSFEPTRGRQRTWYGPAVMASAWRRKGDHGVVMVNITGQPQEVELTVRTTGLGSPGARLVQTWPRPPAAPVEAEGAHRFTLPPRAVRIVVITQEPASAAAGRPLLSAPWELVSVVEGELPAARGPVGSLWACADGPVRVSADEDGVWAQALWRGPDGQWAPRVGRQAEVRGARAEGRGLPRAAAEQPWALLRRLPHTAVTTGDTIVLAGDDDHLLAEFPGSAQVTFDRPGAAVLRDLKNGRVTVETGTTRLELPAGGPYLVGWAHPDPRPLERLAVALGGAHEARLQRLRAAVQELAEATAAEFPARLAGATATWFDAARALGDMPAALAPTAPLAALTQSLSALATPLAGARLEWSVAHDWLAPAEPKPVELALFGDGRSAAGELTATPVGGWAAGGLRTEAAEAVESSGALRRRFVLTLDDGRYVERVVPLLGDAALTVGGLTLHLPALTWLEANRPLELRTPKGAMPVVAGRRGEATVVFRNSSPEPYPVEVTAAAPNGWSAVAEPRRLTVPGLSDGTVALRVEPPVGASPGSYIVRCEAVHPGNPTTRLTGLVQASLLPMVVPLDTAPAEWPRPEPANRAIYRRAGELAIWVAAGETIRVELRNVRVTVYEDALGYTLRDPDLQPLASGRVEVDQATVIERRATQEGTHYLSLAPRSGSADAIVDNRWAAEVATEQQRVSLFCSPITRWFYVPPGAREFRLRAIDGGPDETCRFQITSPNGRIALDRDGNYQGEALAIEVKPGEDGRLWVLRAVPRQDVEFWLEGDVCPYLSTAPERVLKVAD